MNPIALAKEHGFDPVGLCPTGKLRVRSEVRDMCAANRCGRYGKSWSCPPACGTLEDFEEIVRNHSLCLVVETVSNLDDEFDIEGMLAAEQAHKRDLAAFARTLAKENIEHAILGAGSCTICAQCAYPDAPCRFPERRFVSLEAAGIVASEACEAAGLAYYHGPRTIAYISCVLL